MGLLAGAAVHWVAAGLMVWEQASSGVSDSSMPERVWRVALGLATSLFGLA
ncbi:MAG: hypothetical protein H0X67_02220 [Acidobacteria bacterium]|nr:hypothetical protein [Acidobacteriota bacterium]